jgi:tetratricopeptide (TPR) repeat protein
MTAKYNGWFNANELLEASVLKLEEQHIDNYNEILPIYEYAAVENADAVKPDLDEAIKKVSVVVTLHEYSDWADDCYLLIGQAEYLKRDYEAAENALEFYMDEFQPNGKRTTIKERKRKKGSSASAGQSAAAAKEANRRQKELQKARKKTERERKAYNKQLRKRKKKGQSTDDLVRPGTVKAPDGTTAVPTPDAKKYEPSAAELQAKKKAEGEQSSIFLNEPVYDEAILWLAKTYIERENWTSADYQFRRLEGDDILLPKVYEELPVARAYYHMKRENFPQVIPFLEQAIERSNDRGNKARYSYIIAQLHDRAGNVQAANEYYQKSLDFSNQYDMEFNTQLAILRSGVRTGSMSRADAQASLEKMSKDYKNQPYLGRIYFTMANLALDEKDVKGAIAHLEKSVETVGNDKFQQIESQYLLATLYMQEMMYVEADGAYKATAAIMDQDDPRYRDVKKLADNLTEIAINLNEIQLQDSLLVLSYKTDDELKALAKEIKKARQKEADAAAANSKYVGNADKKMTPTNPAVAGRGDLPTPIVAGGQASTFWAFDTKNLKKTRREFERTWGDIGLTDYWRVNDKADQFASSDENLEPGADGEIGLYESEIEDFFKDVPKSDSARALSHTQIRKSMLLLGGLYRDRLEDFNSSIEILEAILTKYPDAPEKLEIYYQLYLSSLSGGDHARAEKYKRLIIDNYPNSRFAKVLSDPNFAASQQSEKDRLIQYYDETYDLFESGQHEQVLTRVRDLEDKFGLNNILMGKFELLKAMSLGSQVGKDAYVEALKYIIARYPNSEEEKKAKDMLLLLGDASTGKGYGEKGLEAARFTMEDNALHFVIVYVKNQETVSINDSKVAIADFHKKFFQLDNLKMTNLVFDPTKNHSLILVRSFTTKDKAMKYYETAVRNPNVFLPKGAEYEVYPITQKNYREVIKARELATYKQFFEANY